MKKDCEKSVCARRVGTCTEFEAAIGASDDHRRSGVKQAAAFVAGLKSCRSLHNKLAFKLYGQIQVGNWVKGSALSLHRNNSLFWRSLNADASLQSQVTTVHLKGLAAAEIYPFFKLPKINTIKIDNLEEQDPLDLGDVVRFSSVKELYLVNCGAVEEPLTQMLTWLEKLEVLYYQMDQISWEDEDFSGEAIERCLNSQEESIIKLVLNRSRGRDQYGYTNVLDLHQYSAITSLSVANVFLTGEDQALDVSGYLPPDLEELEVDYDETRFVDFYDSDDTTPGWLFKILSSKSKCMPKLQRVRIVADWSGDDEPEDEPEDEDEHCNRNSSELYPDWRPPRRLRDAFHAAQVCYSIYLNDYVRYRRSYVGVKDFKDPWEDDLPGSWS